MKAFKYLLCACTLVMSWSASFAQLKGGNNKDVDNDAGGVVLSNYFGDNWFAGASIGVTVFQQKNRGFAPLVGIPAIDLTVGKWLTPETGVRFGYQGLNGRTDSSVANGEEGATERFNYAYIHGDFLLNVSNLYGGYSEDRVWNFIPYAHYGYLAIYNCVDGDNMKDAHISTNRRDNEIAAGVGILNTFRLTGRAKAIVDIREMLFSGRYHNYVQGGVARSTMVTFGLQRDFGRFNSWKRSSGGCCAALADARAALSSANAALNAANESLAASVASEAALREELEKLRKEKSSVKLQYELGVAPIVLYFDVNSTELNYTERQHLDAYVRDVIAKDSNRTFYLTGTADKSTGTAEINAKLSRGRVENVMNILRKEYGISSDRLVLKDTRILEDHPDNPSLDRSVVIEH